MGRSSRRRLESVESDRREFADKFAEVRDRRLGREGVRESNHAAVFVCGAGHAVEAAAARARHMPGDHRRASDRTRAIDRARRSKTNEDRGEMRTANDLALSFEQSVVERNRKSECLEALCHHLVALRPIFSHPAEQGAERG